MSKILMLTSALLLIGKAWSFYNKSYDGYTFILPDNVTDHSSSSSMQLSFTDAQSWCTKTVAGSTLAAIRNKDIQRDFTQFITSALQDNSYWQRVIHSFTNIRLNGKYHIRDDWRWINGHPKAADLTVHNTTDKLYPFYARVKNLGIYSSTQDKIGRFICEYPGNPEQCRALLNERCYKKYSKSSTWYDARNNCSDGGGDLASFESLSDMNINASLKNLSLDSNAFYWIGLQKNEWQWVDTGSTIKYTNWEILYPSNYSLRCLCITRYKMEWNECDCSEPYPFICILNDISATTDFVIIIASCGAVIFIMVIIISAAALIVKKRGNSDAPRAVMSFAYENPEYAVTDDTKDFPVYAEVQEPNASNSASNTTYAKVEMAENTYVEQTVNGIVYAELDLTSRP